MDPLLMGNTRIPHPNWGILKTSKQALFMLVIQRERAHRRLHRSLRTAITPKSLTRHSSGPAQSRRAWGFIHQYACQRGDALGTEGSSMSPLVSEAQRNTEAHLNTLRAVHAFVNMDRDQAVIPITFTTSFLWSVYENSTEHKTDCTNDYCFFSPTEPILKGHHHLALDPLLLFFLRFGSWVYFGLLCVLIAWRAAVGISCVRMSDGTGKNITVLNIEGKQRVSDWYD